MTQYYQNNRSRAAYSRRRRQHRHGMWYTVILLIIITSICALIATAATATKISDTEQYYVIPGDTLWDIAQQCNTKSDNVYNVMDDIMKLNNMKSSQLHAGDSLIIPVY